MANLQWYMWYFTRPYAYCLFFYRPGPYERALIRRMCELGLVTLSYGPGGIEVGRPGHLPYSRKARTPIL